MNGRVRPRRVVPGRRNDDLPARVAVHDIWYWPPTAEQSCSCRSRTGSSRPGSGRAASPPGSRRPRRPSTPCSTRSTGATPAATSVPASERDRQQHHHDRQQQHGDHEGVPLFLAMRRRATWRASSQLHLSSSRFGVGRRRSGRSTMCWSGTSGRSSPGRRTPAVARVCERVRCASCVRAVLHRIGETSGAKCRPTAVARLLERVGRSVPVTRHMMVAGSPSM